MIKKIFLFLVVVFVLIQFVRPAKNRAGDTAKDIRTKYAVPDSVANILARACNDCHTNNTRYPWYAEVQPVAWWLNNHIVNGKRHFNLSEYAGRRINYQYKKMDDCIEQIDKGEMPLESYTWIHKDAILTEAEKATLKNWCENVKDSIKAWYPADSLKMPKRGPKKG
jgi:hypothetical protein